MAATSTEFRGAMVDARGNPEARNMRLVGHCNMDWRGDGMHINLKDGYAFFAHMGDHGIGTSIVDVRDPEQPRLVKQLEVPEGIHSHKVQIVGDTLLVNYERYKGGSGQGGSAFLGVGVSNDGGHGVSCSRELWACHPSAAVRSPVGRSTGSRMGSMAIAAARTSP